MCYSDFHVDSFMIQNSGWLTKNLLPKGSAGYAQGPSKWSTRKWKGSNILAFVGAGALGLLGMAGSAYADEAEHGLAAPSYPWANDGWFSSYDHASLVPLLCTKYVFKPHECSGFCLQSVHNLLFIFLVYHFLQFSDVTFLSFTEGVQCTGYYEVKVLCYCTQRTTLVFICSISGLLNCKREKET